MFNGAHVILFTRDPEGMRAWFRDVLELPSVDAGAGWLIFALPPAEIAVHPAAPEGREGGMPAPSQLLYLMCDDLHDTVERLRSRGVETAGPITEQSWGLLTSLRTPEGGQIGLYQPRHPSPRWAAP